MLYELFTHMNQATAEQIQLLLPLASDQRRADALRYKHLFGQFCSLKSYAMLRELLGAVSPTLDGQMPEFTYNEHGKPFLAGREDYFFSISHTKTAILVAISGQPIGVDVEQIRTPSDGLIQKTMNPEEQALIAASPSPAQTFTSLWTQKEAVLKLRGTGILDELHDVLPNAARDGIRIATHTCPGARCCYSFAQWS